MRGPALLLLLSACQTSSVEPVKVDFVQTPTTFVLSPADGGRTHVVLKAGTHDLDFGIVEGRCAPTADRPFTQVEGQPVFAALACASPDGGVHHAVIIEVSGEDPNWTWPVGMALVLTRPMEEGRVALVTMGGVELPLGVVPVAPIIEAAPPAEGVPPADVAAPAGEPAPR